MYEYMQYRDNYHAQWGVQNKKHIWEEQVESESARMNRPVIV
jgi:hypothetical protein